MESGIHAREWLAHATLIWITNEVFLTCFIEYLIVLLLNFICYQGQSKSQLKF